MKTLILLTASTLVLGLAGCAPGGKPPMRTALDCPDRQGDLTRTAMAADRKSCTYRAGDGNLVTLQLMPTNGDAPGALKVLEASLTAPTPEGLKAAAEAEAARKAGEPLKVADGAAASDAERVAREADADAAKAERELADNENDVDVRAPGVHVKAHDGHGRDSDHARIDLPGLHINADGDEERANIRLGGMTIDAGGDGATIRSQRDVRLKGESFSRERRGIRATFIYTGKNLPNGYRFVGYEAAGPKAGPLAVAVVRSNLDTDTHGRAYDDVKRLVRRNSGV